MMRLVFIFLLSLGLTSCSFGGGDLPVPRVAKETRFTMLDGEQVALSSFRGKQLVLVFWAHWCSSSNKLLKKLDSYVAENAAPDTEFLAVNIDKAEKFEKVKGFIDYQLKGNLKHAFSGNEVYDEAYISLGGRNLPHVLIIDPKGMIVGNGHSISVIKEFVG